jgi:hypothetical protein
MLWLIRLGVHVSHDGPVMPDEAWEITDYKALLSDGSNLSTVAKRLDYDKANLTPMPPARPPIKYQVTLEWNKNWAAIAQAERNGKPPPKAIRARRVTMVTAPGNEEAQQEAEQLLPRGGHAEYKIISIEPIPNP